MLRGCVREDRQAVVVELADGRVVEEDGHAGRIRFDGRELEAEITMTDIDDTLIGTELLAGKVLLINVLTAEVRMQDYGPEEVAERH